MNRDSGTTILLVENDLDAAVSTTLALQEAGFQALHALDGHQGLRLARVAQPDLVLLQACLPRMDGFALCRALRQESAVPILLLAEREQDGVRALELGADAFLVRPVGRRELLARVRALLRRRGLERGAHPPGRTAPWSWGPTPTWRAPWAGAPAALARERLSVGEIVMDRATCQVWRGGQPLRLRLV